MDARLVNPFIDATLQILKTVSGTTCHVQKPYVKNDLLARGDITSMIHISGEFQGSVSISFTKECILAIVSKMFGETLTDLNEDIKDAVGEIGNMIAGQANQQIEGLGQALKAGLHEVIMAEKHQIEHTADAPVLAVPCRTDNGDITIEVCLPSTSA